MPRRLLLAVGVLLVPLLARATDADAIARGKKALETRDFSPAPWPFHAYDNAWKQWQPKPDKKPEPYADAFRAHYGLHAAPYENGKYPMGLRPGVLLVLPGLTTDCMM